MPRTLEVRRDDLASARVVEEPEPHLEPGQALLRVERFGATANNVTYGVLGDTVGYWRFFPAPEAGWGRIPAWGFADVLATRAEGVGDGDRVFGYVPMASHVVVTAAVGPDGFADVTPHRAQLPRAYNAYRRAGAPSAHDDAEVVLRPLFVLAFLVDDALRDTVLVDAATVLVTSASSKTSLTLAYLLSRAGVRVVGLTSARHAAFVRQTGPYDEVVVYDAVDDVAPEPAALVDVAGDAAVRRAVHERFGDALRASVLVGTTHRDPAAFVGDDDLPGPAPATFFAPERLRLRARAWGRPALEARMADSWDAVAAWSASWLTVRRGTGRDAVLTAWHDVVAGQVAPDAAHVLSLEGDAP